MALMHVNSSLLVRSPAEHKHADVATSAGELPRSDTPQVGSRRVTGFYRPYSAGSDPCKTFPGWEMREVLSPERLVPKITKVRTRLGHNRALPPGLSALLPGTRPRQLARSSTLPCAQTHGAASTTSGSQGCSRPPLLCTTGGLSLVNGQPSQKTREGKHELTPSWQSRATHAPLGPLFQLWERPRGQAGASSPLLLLHKPGWARQRALAPAGGDGEGPSARLCGQTGPRPTTAAHRRSQQHLWGHRRSGSRGGEP